MIQKHICPPWCKIQVYPLCRSKTCPKQVSMGLKYIKWTTQWFDLDLWTCVLKINSDHQLIGSNPCTKFGIDQMKGSKDIKRTTLGLQTDRPTYRPSDSCKTICPLFQGGGGGQKKKKQNYKSPTKDKDLFFIL